MKKKLLLKLLVLMITVTALLTGCGEQEAESNKGSVQVNRESETQEIGGENVDSKPIEKIDFTWELSDFELYQLMKSQGEVSPSLFKGTVAYADGTEGDIDAEKVTLETSTDGTQMLIGVEFRGDIFYYKVNIQEMWGDGENLTEEQIENFKNEGSSSGSEGNSVSVSYDDWGVTPVDMSDYPFAAKVTLMCDILSMWKNSSTFESTNKDEIMADISEHYSDYEGKDVVYTYTISKSSDWYSYYGDSHITEVYRAYNLPEYGEWVDMCKCGAKEEAQSLFMEYFNLSKTDFMAYHGTASYLSILTDIPLSWHKKSTLSKDDMIEYFVNTYRYKKGYDENDLYMDDFILRLYDLSVADVEAKFRAYIVDSVNIKNVLSFYEVSKENFGYTGSIVDWYRIDGESLKPYVRDVLIYDAERVGWQNIPKGAADKIIEYGGTIPEYATYAE